MKQNLALLLFLVFSGLSVAAQTTELLVNQPLEQIIGDDKSHIFSFKTQAGDFCRITVEQQNADVRLKIFTPGGQLFYEINNSNSREEGERASFIAENTGEIQIEISFIRKLSGTGQGKDYRLNLEPLRPPTEKDAIRIKAERLYDEANRMRLTSDRQSRQNSIKVFHESAKMFVEAGDRLGEAFVYYSLGQVHSLLSNFTEAHNHHAQAAAIFRDLNLRRQYARALTDQGAAYFFERNFEQAEKLCLEALRIFAEIDDRRGEAEIVGNLGAISDAQDQPRKALDYYFRALPILQAENDKAQESSILSRVGSVYDDLGEPLNSLNFYERALKIRRDLQDARAEANTLANMSIVLKNLGYYDRATEANERALQIFSQIGQKFGEAVILNNLGNLSHELNDNEKALEFYAKSLGIIREIKLPQNEAETLLNVASIKLGNGEISDALQLFNQSLQIFRQLKSKRGEGRTLVKIGESHLKNRDFAKSLEFFNQALPIFREIEDRNWEGTTLFLIGEAKRISGDIREARDLYLSALKIKKDLKEVSEETQNLLSLAKVERAAGNLTESQKYIEQSIKILENTRANLSRPTGRTTYFSAKQSFYEFYIDLLAAQGKKAEAFQASEQARARSLLESLGESRFNIRAGISPENLEKEKLLRQTINAKDVLRINALNAKQSEKAKVFEKELDELLRQYADLQAKIRLENPDFAALSQPQILSPNKFQAEVLDENSVLLEYSLGEERSFLFVVNKTSLEVVELPKRAEIEKSARQFIENIKNYTNENLRENPQGKALEAKTDWKKERENLSRMLFGSALKKVENNRLLIVASGILQYVPFAALANPEESNKFLIETNEIVYLPSASVLTALRNTPRKKQAESESLAIIADPVFAPDDVRVKNFAKTNSPDSNVAKNNSPRGLRSGFSRLRFSRREAEEIGKFLPESKRMLAFDFAANLKTAQSDYLQKAKYIHFATHGVINSDLPELSGIVFSLVDENGKPQDGFLRLHDIYNMRLNADLVVLSACDTALGKEIKGEGIIGLTRGFMYAGAPGIVASLWKVEDRATAELMKRFYRALLKDKQKTSMALRTAQIEMLKDEQWRNPFYWAAFTLQGDWQ